MNIYVGNISFDATEAELKALFEAHGSVENANIVKDRYSGRPRGFGFVEMPNGKEANAAISALNGSDFKGRNITVNEARPRRDRGNSGGYRRNH